MVVNQIEKIKTHKKDVILCINQQEYPIDTYYYECLLPYEGKVLQVSQMLEVIAFSAAIAPLKKLYKKIFNHMVSAYEVKETLKRYNVLENQITLIIQFLKNEGHLNEKDFVKHYQEIYEQKKGKKAFKTFLIQKHISSHSIDMAMDSFLENEDYAYEYAQNYLNKKVSSNAMKKQMVLSHLVAKGYSKTTIQNVLQRLVFQDEEDNLRVEFQKYKKKYPQDSYKIISKLANKGYNVKEIKKIMKEERLSYED